MAGNIVETHRLDQKHVAILYPSAWIRAWCFRCQVYVALATGELTQSTFVGEGRSGRQARDAAIRKAQEAVKSHRISY